ncbi:hypothetical protein KAT36_04495 [Candidatus Pacearchaeota archaeon]|nr:hypothetical protein [Candidatus Pacearchaeota archaeon]
MEEGVIKNSEAVFGVLIFGIILVMSFVFAAHVIALSPFSVDEDVSSLYNISVQNTDTVTTANITQVNITFPFSFSFSADSNGTDAGTHTFTNTTTVLSWDNDGLVMNGTTQYFWFNATAFTPGSYNLTIVTTNSTGPETTNISVTINDTTDPSSIEFVSPTESDNSNLSQSNIAINITATDNGVIDTIIARLFNSTKDQINSSTSATSPLFINFTGLDDGVYYFNATVNDTYGNSNSTSTRTITLDSSNPVITLIEPADSTSSTTSAYNFTFNVTDDQTISNCSLILNGSIINTLTSVNNSGGTNGMYNSSLSVATHTWSINCTDFAGNVGNSSTRTLIVSAVTTVPSSSGGSGGYPTYRPNEEELKEGYRKTMYKNWKISFKLGDDFHVFKVENVTEATAKISISSETQEATLLIGEEKKFDISGNDYYDVLVKLNSIDFTNKYYPKADFTIKTISEKIPVGEEMIEEAPMEEREEPELKEEEEKKDLTWLWIVIAIVIVFILSGIRYKKFKK